MVEEIFREGVNRDVMLRSGKVLQFLCGMEGKLSPEHIDLIWGSCTKTPRAELQVRARRTVPGAALVVANPNQIT